MSGATDIVVELKEERVKRAPLKDSEFEHAGAMLMAAREAGGFSIEDASDATNVRADYLEAIEQMDIESLPIPAYTAGFVKAYAQFLELPVEPMVQRFRKEAGYAVSHIAPEVSIPTTSELSGGRELSLIAILAIVFFVIWVAWQMTRPPADSGPVDIQRTPLQERAAANTAQPIEVQSEASSIEVPLAETTASFAVAEQEAVAEEEALAEEAETSAAGDAALVEEAADEAELFDGTIIEGFGETVETAEPALPEETIVEEAPAAADELMETAAEEEQTVSDILDTLPVVEDTTPVSTPPAETQQSVPAPVQTPAFENTTTALLTEPSATRQVAPIYPQRCERRASDVEIVKVVFDVNSRGRAVNQRISESSNSCFNGAALSAVGRWRFDPATRNGNAVTAYDQSTTFRFQLPQ
jgi:TonB family protein